MTTRPLRRALPLALAFAALLALAPDARAIDVQSDAAVESAKSLGDYLEDLGGNSDPDRLFAARVLLGELKRALRTEARARPGSLAQLDAQALLVELQDRLPRACLTAVRFQNAVAPCADIFALLEETSALPVLREVLAGETRKGPRKHLEQAIATLEALAPATVPAIPTPPTLPMLPTPPADPPGPLPPPGPPPTTSPLPSGGGEP